MKKFFLWLLGLICLGFVGAKLYKISQTDALYEAVVRYTALKDVTPRNPPQFTIFFVSINRQDPSPNFLERFKDAPFSVRPASQGKETFIWEDGHVIIDSNTKEKGQPINLGHIVWFGLSHPQVHASGPNGGIYVMKREGGQWHVDYRAIPGG